MKSIKDGLFQRGDIVKIAGLKWNWRLLRREFPDQISEDFALNANPIADRAEVTHVEDIMVDKQTVRQYRLRFPGDYTLLVGTEFAIKHLEKLGRSVFAEQEDKEEAEKTQGGKDES